MATRAMSVLVLGGGPDAEREISLRGAKAVGEALRIAGAQVIEKIIDRPSPTELRRGEGDVVFPVLHGAYGEGGPLQDTLEELARPYVGSPPRASRLAMDKTASKAIAQSLAIPTPAWHVLCPRDDGCAFELPVVLKPVHEGSTLGLRVCRTRDEWRAAVESVRAEWGDRPGRAYMVEPMVTGPGGAPAREITVGLLDGRALPVIEIRPAKGLYDYDAKYERDDTEYIVNPPLPPGIAETAQRWTAALAHSMGIRHIARADFMLDAAGVCWFLEINSMPGFTDHSLVPMAARHVGIDMPRLCAGLVEAAMRDAGSAAHSPTGSPPAQERETPPAAKRAHPSQSQARARRR